MRDQDPTYGTTPGSGSDLGTGTGAGFGTAGTVGGVGSAGGTGTLGTTRSIGTDEQDESRTHHAGETAREKLGSARERVSEKASDLKATLADKLEAGAQKLRQRNAPGDGATDMGLETTGTMGSSGQRTKVDRATDSLASGMESTANWVRNANVDDMKNSVEQQVRSNPGRALIVAVGVGYLLGKLFRGGGNRTT